MTRDEAIAAVKAVFPDAVETRVEGARDWALLRAGVFDDELVRVREAGERARFYAELKWVAYEMGRKLGWAAFFYKDVYGEWPPWDWKEDLLPMEPRESTRKQVRKRDRLAREAWKEKKRAEREARGDTTTEAEDSTEEDEDVSMGTGEDCGLEAELGASTGDGDVLGE